MKILFVTPGMTFGGAERVMSVLANHLVDNGYEVGFVIINDDPKSVYELDSRVEIKSMPTARFDRIGNLPRLIKTLRANIKAFAPDISVSFFSATAMFVKIASTGLRIPMIYSERNDPYNNIKGVKSKMFQRFALAGAKKVVFQTRGAQQYYGRGIIRKSSIILNPFDTSAIPERSAEAEKTIVSVGRLCAQKNQAILIDAFKKISDKHPEYKLIIYGEGPLRRELQNRIESYGLEERVLLAGNKSNVMDYTKNAYAFAFSSDFEGLPNALIEAMALGLPCVSTDCSPGGARELIRNRENGMLVPCGDSEKMADAMDYILSNPSEAAEMGRRASQISDRLNVDKICGEWIGVFNSVI